MRNKFPISNSILKRFLPLLTLLGALVWLADLVQAEETCGQWNMIELSFTAQKTYGNPYMDVDMHGEFRGPDGQVLLRPAFWDGGSTWRIRFTPTTDRGSWTWRTVCSNPNDAGLHNRQGELRAVAHQGANPLLKRGLLRMSGIGRSVVHADHTPFLMVADTPWALPFRGTLDSVAIYAADRQAKGFNTALLMSLQPDRGARGPRSRTELGGFDVAFEDLPNLRLTQINNDYFRCLDQLMEILIDHGIVPAFNPVFHGYGWKGLGAAGRDIPANELARYARYLVARYGARPAMWIVSADSSANHANVAPTGREFEDWDAYRQPTGIHYHPAAGPQHQDALWLDFQWCQTGHAAEHNIIKVGGLYDNLPTKAAANGEPTYENITWMGNAAGWWQGHEAWLQLTAGGTMGVAYGAGGLWQWKFTASESGWSDFANTGASWQDALAFSGSRYAGLVGRAFAGPDGAGYDSTDMLKRPDLAGGQPCLAVAGRFYVVYLAEGGAVSVSGLQESLPYHWFDPGSGQWLAGGWTAGAVLDVKAPSAKPWVLMVGKTGTVNVPPQVAITSPAAGQIFPAGTSITITADAVDPDGTVRLVEFFADNTKIGESTASPWTLRWTNVPAGSYDLTAHATDNASGRGASAEVLIRIPLGGSGSRVNDGLVTLYPLNENSGSTAFDGGAGAPLNLGLTPYGARWVMGAVRLDGYGALRAIGSSAKLHQRLSASGRFTIEVWARPSIVTQGGPARIVTYSTDNTLRNFTFGHGSSASRTRVSSFRLRTTELGDENGLPQINSGNIFLSTLAHYVVTFDGRHVRLYRNGILHLEEARSGLLSNWDSTCSLLFGTETTGATGWRGDLHLAAIYERQLSLDEIERNFAAGPDMGPIDFNQPPEVSITAPIPGTVIDAGSSITISAQASDPDGTVQLVEFFANGSKIGQRTASPWTITWTEVPAGSYSLTARATDDQGAAATSSPVAIMVRAASGGSVVERRVSSSADDAEERLDTHAVNLTSSDLELVRDRAIQLVGLRFTDLQIPRGARIDSASAQFTVDEINSEATSLSIRAQASGNAPAFTTATGNISSRNLGAATVQWSPPAWNSIGASGPEQRTPDLSAVIQEVVNRGDWSIGNSLVLVIGGSGKRVAHAYDGNASLAPLLSVTWQPVQSRVSSSADDAEERLDTHAVNLTSSDLELVRDRAVQLVGLRFTDLQIPRGARIDAASAQFTVDEINSEATSLSIRAQASGNAPAFTTATGNISSRNLGAATVQWSPPAWNSIGASGPEQRTPDLSAVIQEVVNRGDWSIGNSLVLVIGGSGKRVAHAYDGNAALAPLLSVTWQPVNQPPLAAITAPGEGASFDAGSSITISAQASDPDGTVQLVEFFANGSKIGQRTVSPWTITWTDVPAGSYSLTARATDNQGATATSSAVSISTLAKGIQRITDGLVAYYPLDEGSGLTAYDHGPGVALNLQLSGGASWVEGGVRLDGSGMLRAIGSSAKLYQALTASGSFTVEVWAQPGALSQGGPARMVTYSASASARNFTLGHGSNSSTTSQHLSARLRTSGTGDSNGLPQMEVADGIVNGTAHYVMTFDGAWLRLYRNGALLATGQRSGTLLNWNSAYHLALGNEVNGGRGWRGELFLAAIYQRALSGQEIAQNFAAGLDGDVQINQLKLAAFDSDGDGMDDGWELAYFGDLSRDGAGDFDGDGFSDLDEFLAGTDPTDAVSLLRVLKLEMPLSREILLFWQAVPGRIYQVEYKNDLSDGDWQRVEAMVEAADRTASLRLDQSEEGKAAGRFYRVLQAPMSASEQNANGGF